MAHLPNRRSFADVKHLETYHPGMLAVADIFTRECMRNDPVYGSQKCEPQVLYSSDKAAQSIHDFLVRLTKYGMCSPQVMVVMKIFADRFVAKKGCPITSRSVSRIVLGAFVIAAKLRDDCYYTNDYYGTIGGLPAFRVNQIERVMLEGLDWELAISPEEFEAHDRELRAEAARIASVPPSPALVALSDNRGIRTKSAITVSPGLTRERLPFVDDMSAR